MLVEGGVHEGWSDQGRYTLLVEGWSCREDTPCLLNVECMKVGLSMEDTPCLLKAGVSREDTPCLLKEGCMKVGLSRECVLLQARWIVGIIRIFTGWK